MSASHLSQVCFATRTGVTVGGWPRPMILTSSTKPGSLPLKRSGSGVPAYQVRSSMDSMPCQSPRAR
ncbi:calcineurin-like phosphoesterase family 7 domain protein [Burkholderia pseudomallei MSHR3709]|nr:calcineurin-like phosphoesterase family 7 domain protein [Burkholderia pseudomallei MSHR3709]